jgi:hypothetical protein
MRQSLLAELSYMTGEDDLSLQNFDESFYQ